MGIFLPTSTETAVANGDTRTLNLYHSHTGESIQATFRINGAYDPAVLEKLNWFLRDWRNNDQTRMDPRLFDVIWEVYRTAGASEPIVIVSAYRSPETNAMLRRRSKGVAEHSQHILGRAMDTTMPGMPMERIREIGMRLQRGGVGWYPGANFVHLDVGGVRSWPRMSYDQLARLFPDGKTVHLAADGRALPRYAEARAELASRGSVVADIPQASPVGNFFAWLFGKRDEAQQAAPVEAPPAAEPRRGRRGRVEVASLRGARTGATVTNAAGAAAPQEPGAAGALPAPALTQANAAPAAASPAPERSSIAEAGPAPVVAEVQDLRKDQRAARQAAALAAPLPPPRPALAASSHLIAAADVPLPPARPGASARLASIAVAKAPAESGLPRESGEGAIPSEAQGAASVNSPANMAALPMVITEGPKDRQAQPQLSVPKQILAFAAETPAQDLRRPLAGAADRADHAGDTAAGGSLAVNGPAAAARSSHGLQTPAGNSSTIFPSQPSPGKNVTGLRRAARIIPDMLSNRPMAEYVSSFGAAASDLDPAHFGGGAAVKPLALAQGFVRITGSNPMHRN
ncbi:MAG TPA: DUF882 domain-containing protein [Methylocella sp.]|nr:DUF882 domain-containing protein [Methylocella sp.]